MQRRNCSDPRLSSQLGWTSFMMMMMLITVKMVMTMQMLMISDYTLHPPSYIYAAPVDKYAAFDICICRMFVIYLPHKIYLHHITYLLNQTCINHTHYPYISSGLSCYTQCQIVHYMYENIKRITNAVQCHT